MKDRLFTIWIGAAIGNAIWALIFGDAVEALERSYFQAGILVMVYISLRVWPVSYK